MTGRSAAIPSDRCSASAIASIAIGVFLLTSVPLLTSVAASAAPAQVERQGSQVVRELESGKLRCGEASADDFERVGEYVMGRMLGPGSDHAAMDEMMSRMTGAGSEARIHGAMGRRFAGCGGGQLPAGFGRMMGAVNAIGMMGGYGSESSADDDFDGPSAAATIGMMAVLIGGVAVALLWIGRRRPGGPLDILDQRYARGELSAEAYRERRGLLEESR